MDFSHRITAIRKEMKYSQEKFGELVGMSQRSVAAWESGDRFPSYAVLSDLADRLDVSVDYLLGRTEDKKIKEQPTDQDGELLSQVISRIQDLPDPALARVSDFLNGIQAGQEIAAEQAAAPDPDGVSAE